MPLPLFAGPLIGAGASTLLGELFGESSADKRAQRLAAEGAALQNQNLRQAQEHQEALKRIARLPSAMSAILDRTGGVGFAGPTGFERSGSGGSFSLTPTGGTDPRSILSGINFDDERIKENLHALLGLIPQNTGLIAQGANVANQNALGLAGSLGGLSQNIVESLLFDRALKNQGSSNSFGSGFLGTTMPESTTGLRFPISGRR